MWHPNVALWRTFVTGQVKNICNSCNILNWIEEVDKQNSWCFCEKHEWKKMFQTLDTAFVNRNLSTNCT